MLSIDRVKNPICNNFLLGGITFNICRNLLLILDKLKWMEFYEFGIFPTFSKQKILIYEHFLIKLVHNLFIL